jgi:hypothetical protein
MYHTMYMQTIIIAIKILINILDLKKERKPLAMYCISTYDWIYCRSKSHFHVWYFTK